MKKFSKLSLALLAGILFMFTACDKNPATPIDVAVEREIPVDQMANRQNPYDEEGKRHNDFLQYFQANVDDPAALNQERIMALVRDYHEASKLEYNEFTARAYEQTFAEFQVAGIGGPYYDFNWCRRFPILCSFLPGPFLPFNLLQASNGGTATDRVSRFLEAVKKKESELLASKEIDEDAKTALLIYTTVARHSAAYWHNELEVKKSGSKWTGWTAGTTAAKAKPCHTCDVIGADASGATIGFFFGGPWGAGIGGGVASAASIIEKLWF